MTNAYPVWTELLANSDVADWNLDSEASALATLESSLASLLGSTDSDVLQEVL